MGTEWKKVGVLPNFKTDKPRGKRPLARPFLICENFIRMYLKEIGISRKNWIDSAQDRDYSKALVNLPLKLQVP